MKMNKSRASIERFEPRVMFVNLLPGFTDTLVAGDLFAPVSMDFAPDGRIFVTEKNGTVRVVKDGATLPTPFVEPDVNADGERGVLGVVLDPNFSQNNYVYVYYTATQPTIHNRVSRFTAAGDVAAAGSETVILDLDPVSDANNHNGGHIRFGPDGKLYVAQGENGQGQLSQTLETRFGKILRINADGSIPSDNPFFNTATADNRSIWALGLRNPFTFAFHPTTGRMLINDVGGGAFEEINEGVAGANYGWPLQEGTPSANPAFTNPIFFYGRDASSRPSGNAITGGAFYAGGAQQFPVSYNNDYFFGDLSQFIWKIDAETGAATEFATDIGPAVDLLVGPDGSLYYAAYTVGEIRKISFDGANIAAPSITTQPAAVNVVAGQPATFIVQATGDGLTYQWQRDGVDIEGATSASYTLQSPAASDNGAAFRVVISGASGSSVTSDAATLTLSPGQGPTAIITSPIAGRLFQGRQTIKFKGRGTDPEDGKLGADALSWRVEFVHDGVTDVVLADTPGIRAGSFRVPREGLTSADSLYRVSLTVTDSDGGTNTVTRDVLPRTVQIAVTPSQPGLLFNLDGASMSTPTTFTAIAGTRRSLTADATQVVDGVTYSFRMLANRRRPELTLIVPAKDRELQLAYVGR
jgi:glucose/arabinose dehydrogenase